MSLIKICPKCKEARPPGEIVCGSGADGGKCGYPLYDISPVLPVPPEEITACAISASSQSDPATCANGHPMEAGEFMCGICGETSAAVPDTAAPLEIKGWIADATPTREAEEASFFRVSRQNNGISETASLKHYLPGIEPQTALYPALSAIDSDHSTRLIEFGRDGSRAFEIWEHLPLGALDSLAADEKSSPAFLRSLLRELGSALSALHSRQIIHRNLHPANTLLRSLDPLDLVLSDFGSAAVSELDLQPGTTLTHSRYAAPETVAGVSSPASDWWSLGVIILENLTGGKLFENTGDQAFILHLVTRGLTIPADLPHDWRELLMGLLTRDHSRRWSWDQASRWLDGERGIVHGYFDPSESKSKQGRSIRLAGRDFPSPESFALAAAESENWDDARHLVLTGRIATWLDERGVEIDGKRAAAIRTIAADVALPEDARFALCLLTLNDNLPLCLRGEIVSPAWIAAHPDIASEWIGGKLPGHLHRLGREGWLVRLRERSDRVRSRISDSGTGLHFDPDLLSAALLATSRIILEKRWHDRRKNFPESEHPLLASAIARRAQSEDDLTILVAAPVSAFRPASEVIAETLREATEAGIPVEEASLAPHFTRSRRATFDALDETLLNFVRCGSETADRWADAFRQERRISLPRALVLLSVPPALWIAPPRQEYVRNILDFFRRRIIGGLQRGALVRMTIARTSARLDLTELAGPLRTAANLIAIFLTKSEKNHPLDPEVLIHSPDLENRIRRLIQNTVTYRRDTGIDALYLGFPFVVIGSSGTTRPRIAPLLLWPARLESSAGTRASARLSFDPSRGEIRINPALDSLLGDRAEKWREALDDLRGRDQTDIRAILDALRPLAETPPPTLSALPPVTHRVAPGSLEIHASAVLFHCDFSGQTLAEDLAQLAHRSIEGTALAALIRSGETQEPEPAASAPPEHDRYFTAASDPSQEAAVFRARQVPGLVVQGPPGTGKSQTIVNIVGDAVGRGERILIVCQKPAALEVVRKRLEAEGLGRRLFFLQDTTSDRKPTLAALRDQLERPTRSAEYDRRLALEREAIAAHITLLENTLDQAHQALHQPEAGRPSYRVILDRLLEMASADTPPLPVPRLRVLLGKIDEHCLELLITRISPLAPLWCRARFEGSPLAALAEFESDEFVHADFFAAAAALKQVEDERNSLLAAPHSSRDFPSMEEAERWLDTHESALRKLPRTTLAPMAKWCHVFKPQTNSHTLPAGELMQWLGSLGGVMTSLPHPENFYAWLATREPNALLTLQNDAARLTIPPDSFLSRISPTRWLAQRRFNAALIESLGTSTALTPDEAREAAAMESSLREAKSQFLSWLESLGETVVDPSMPLPAFRHGIRDLAARLTDPLATAELLATFPSPEIADELRNLADPADWSRILDDCRGSLALWHATQRCEACLKIAASWFSPEWTDTHRSALTRRQPTDDSLTEIFAARETLAAYQEFRIRSKELPPEAMEIFSILRSRETDWKEMPDSSLVLEVSRSLRHESLLRWKSLAETNTPSLLMGLAETEGKIATLRENVALMRAANRRLLAECPASAAIAPKRDWDEITMFTGPRAKRLREVVERGEAHGLYHLRPIWLLNPEMVCRVFPLQKDLFDLVIFDEASQLPVEAALPTLYRARRVVVSGDEKQMPPSRFFGATVEADDDSDEEPDADESEADATERIAQATGRREIKDSPDLLTLARGVLPSTTLEIHYRSKYRHLIAFSNHAFYGGRLHVPARHPDAEIHRALPLEVDRTDTEYLDQTNPGEADRVVARLAEIWQKPAAERPSCGVVTFNLKQTDLILEKIEARAEADVDFLRALREETARLDGGEDMGFFVKNLENVQGDERDWIIFSTTFGRDRSGVFRRNFGVLGQQGGERRLNVAVTRAREKILLITSIPTESVSNWLSANGSRLPLIPRDYLQAWLAYAEHLHHGDLDSARRLLGGLLDFDPNEPDPARGSAAPSFFVGQVGNIIRDLGHRSVPAAGDAFGFDHAVVDPRTGLFGIGIECDSPDHPVLGTARARELWRPSVVSRSIPAVHRISSKAWHEDVASETKRLAKAIAQALS